MLNARVDGNQPEITKALRKLGASVQPIHTVGKGCPDLLVGYQGKNWLIEVKDPAQPKSKRCLTPDEKKWHEAWQGQVAVIKDIYEILEMFSGRME